MLYRERAVLSIPKEIRHGYNIATFGVYSGNTIKEIAGYLDKYNINYNKYYGFDSFVGLPEEDESVHATSYWYKGNFSSLDYYNTSSVETAKQKIENRLTGVRNLKLIEGFYKDSLNLKLIKTENLQPFSFVEIDCDLYISTKEVLEFLFANNLILNGTVLFFDDWADGLKINGGEPKAFFEMTSAYKINWREINQDSSPDNFAVELLKS